ncbi:MAG: peptidoglycan DD-metalloendopeptidase family protein [Bacilli bacterium]|nr:peptidoglycan DD-metalloendopeptidase family protein [Bacilli bacterium]
MIEKLLEFLEALIKSLLKKLFNHIKRRTIQISKWFLKHFISLFKRITNKVSNKIDFIKDRFKWFFNEYIINKVLLLKKVKHKKLILGMLSVLVFSFFITGFLYFKPIIFKGNTKDNNSLTFVEYNTHTETPTIEESKPEQESISPTPVNNSTPAVDNSYRWPTEAGYYITTYFSWYHDGIDIAGCYYNSNIYAIYGGEVVTSSYTYTNGNYIIIRDDKGVYSMYAHLANRYVVSGQRVEKGTVIGGMGSTGRATGVHLHFSTWYGYPYYGGTPFNPYNLY